MSKSSRPGPVKKTAASGGPAPPVPRGKRPAAQQLLPLEQPFVPHEQSSGSASRWPNLVIRAAAGTGKTYQLSNRYLQLAVDGEPPEQILAATFARKAAAEIMARVITRLADASLDAARRSDLAQSLDRPLTEEDCHRLLGKLLAELHRLRIGTLDSFFVQLAGGFTLELGLPAGWKILDELDDRQLRLEAIRQVLAQGSTAELSALLHLLFKGEATRSVTEQISDIVVQLHGVFADSQPPAWHGLPRPPVLRTEELELAIEQLAAAPEPPGRFADAWRKDVVKAQQYDWAGFIGSGLAKALLSGDGTYGRKPIDGALASLYQPLLAHARGVLVGHLVNQTEASFKLLDAYSAVYRRLKHARRGLRFDDLPRLLADGLNAGLMEHLPWRLDATIGHLLLDEFQDTSLSQWTVLKSFAAACCARGRSFLCVGDVKQAIYRWRGGVAQLFDAVQNELPGIAQQSLAKSYRSSPTVISTVNRVFDRLADNEALASYPAVASQWQAWFEPHSTQRTSLAGYAELRTAPRAAEGQKQKTATLEFAAAQIAALALARQYASLGALVRQNSAVAKLIYLLRSRHGIAASEEGGNPLVDSPAVQLVLSLVKLADHPGDRVAWFHVANSPLADCIGGENPQSADDERAACQAALLRRRLLDDGYGRTIYAWAKILSARCGQRDLDRLAQLVELGYAYDQRAGIRSGQFIDFVRETKVEDPSSARVRVMTIHQAKGLEFDTVVLPELDVLLKGTPPLVAVGRARPFDPIERVCRHANQQICELLPPDYQELFGIWPREAVNESLCMLYVGLTRAVHGLHMIIAPSPPNERKLPQTFAGVIRAALAPGAAEPEQVLFADGHADWVGRSLEPTDAAPPTPAAESLTIRLKAAPARPRELAARSPSQLEGGNRIRLRDAWPRSAEPTLARGTLWHAWFQAVEWLAATDRQPEPSDDCLRAIAGSLPHGLDIDSQIGEFRRVLASAGLRRWFSRATYDDPSAFGFGPAVRTELAHGGYELQVLRERRFALREDDSLLSGSIDRLVLWQRGRQTLAADVIDFKTDRIAQADQLAARVKFYEPQIAAYRRAVARLFHLDAAAVSARLIFVESGHACPLD